MKCTHCASRMTDDCRFCPQCGKPTELNLDSTLSFESPVAGRQPSPPASANALAPRAPAPTAVTAVAAPLDESSLHALLAQANLLRLRGSRQAAIDACVEVLRCQPGNQTAHSLLGDIYRDQGRLDDAIQWYRLAVDLNPNAADEAKLRQTERDRAKKAPMQAVAIGNGRNVNLPVSPYGAAPVGTGTLLGVSPHRWLRGLTVTSLAFLALMLVLLLFRGRAPLRANPAPHPVTMPPAVTPGTPLLPPPNTGSAANSAQPPQEIPSDTAGTGLRPDGADANAPAPLNNRDPQSQQAEPEPTSQNLPTAPIRAVRPLLSSAALPPYASAAAPAISTRALPLTGGMQVAQVETDPAGGSARILLALPERTLTEPARALFVRNAYRAARAVFNRDTRLTRALVQVFSAARAPQMLFAAEVDRLAALRLAVESAPLTQLEQFLRPLAIPQEAAPEASRETLPATPQPAPPEEGTAIVEALPVAPAVPPDDRL